MTDAIDLSETKLDEADEIVDRFELYCSLDEEYERLAREIRALVNEKLWQAESIVRELRDDSAIEGEIRALRMEDPR